MGYAAYRVLGFGAARLNPTYALVQFLGRGYDALAP